MGQMTRALRKKCALLRRGPVVCVQWACGEVTSTTGLHISLQARAQNLQVPPRPGWTLPSASALAAEGGRRCTIWYSDCGLNYLGTLIHRVVVGLQSQSQMPISR
jgi:hypothetical protein